MKETIAIELLDRALAHQRDGRFGEAAAIYRDVLSLDRQNFDALHLLGVLRYQEGRHNKAIDLIGRAIARSPTSAAAHRNLGQAYLASDRFDKAAASFERAVALDPRFAEAFNALASARFLQGRHEESVAHFRRASEIRPEWAQPRLGLGRAFRASGATAAAIESFRAAWMVDPSSLDSAGELVAAIADLVQGESVTEPFTPIGLGSRKPFVSAVFCSIDASKRARAEALYRRLLSELPHEVLCISDASSLAEAYNRAIRRSRGDIVILSHDDIDILAPDFAGRLVRHLETFDAVGVIGATEMTGPSWNWSGHPNLRGWITHRADAAPTLYAGLVSVRPVAPVKVVDGVFIAARRNVFKSIPFDADTFDGFHLYDIDWSYRASAKGFKLATAGDLLLVHESRGNFGDEWRDCAIRFCDKHDVAAPKAPRREIFEAALGGDDELRSFYRIVAENLTDP